MNFIKDLFIRFINWMVPREPPLYEDWMFDEKNWEPPTKDFKDLGDPFTEEFKDLYK